MNKITASLIVLLLFPVLVRAGFLPCPPRDKSILLRALHERNIAFSWLRGKMQANIIADGEQNSGTLFFKMRQDSALLISVRKFGLEAAKIFTDTADYTILYKLENTYESGRITDLTSKFKIKAGLADLQQLIAGNVILPDSAGVTVSETDEFDVISGNSDDLAVSYYLNKQSMLLQKMQLKDSSGRVINLTFDDYRPVVPSGSMPFLRTMEVSSPEGTLFVKLQCEEMQLNTISDLSFSIPGHYEKIN